MERCPRCRIRGVSSPLNFMAFKLPPGRETTLRSTPAITARVVD